MVSTVLGETATAFGEDRGHLHPESLARTQWVALTATQAGFSGGLKV